MAEPAPHRWRRNTVGAEQLSLDQVAVAVEVAMRDSHAAAQVVAAQVVAAGARVVAGSRGQMCGGSSGLLLQIGRAHV